MSTDLEMPHVESHFDGANPHSASPPHRPHHHHRRPSPIVIDDTDDSSLPPPESHTTPSSPSTASEGSSTPSSPETSTKPPSAVARENGKKSGAKPPSGAAASSVSAAGAPTTATASIPSSSSARQKGKQPARSPSPSTPPPPAQPPLQTVRLEIKLGGQENYAVDISALSKATGQRAATPVPVLKPESSDSEGDDEAEGKSKPKKKRKRRNYAAEYYDVTDPFIDDSELTKDERTYFAETKQQGFYVSSGQVALQHNAPAQRKPKSRKLNILPPAASVSAALATLPATSIASLSISGVSSSKPSSSRTKEGTKDAPITLFEDGDESKSGANGLKRKASQQDALGDEAGNSISAVLMSTNGAGAQSISAATASGSKKKRRVEIKPFHPELQVLINQMKEDIAKENFQVKGKFPPSLKPVLAQVALKAVVLGEYDDNFFNLMPTLFPYNKFTMTKLIKRTIWRDHTNLLLDRQNVALQELARLAEEGFVKAKEEYEKSVSQWEKRQEKAKHDAESGVLHSTEGTPVPSDAQGGAGARGDGDNEEHDHEDGAAPSAGGVKGSKDAHRPTKKYRLTEEMKVLIWQLVCLSNECCRIENEKNLLEGSNQVVSDQGVRKSLYQKIVAAFPEGWLSSGQISRDVSVMKKKYEKDSMED